MSETIREGDMENDDENMEDDDQDMDESDSESDSESDDSMEEEEEEETNDVENPQTYLPGQPLADGEQLTVDKSAYRMLHQAETGAPCLSFDIIRDNMGNSRETYPLTMYMIAGTQAAQTHVNNLLVMKMSNLNGTRRNDDSDRDSDDSSDSEDEDVETQTPIMTVASIKHQGCVNRVKSAQFGNKVLAASWSELGRVSIWDLSEQLKAVDDPLLLSKYRKRTEQGDNSPKPLFTFKGHLQEGYGLDWCQTEPGTLASGDRKGNIHVWRYNNGGSGQDWHVDLRSYNSHAPNSVEDIQWSPNERHVLATCSVDRSVRIWDTRANPHTACMITARDAHTADANVISWNRTNPRFIVSGGDDAVLHVWDLRYFSVNSTKPIATFKHHTAPISSVEWHPDDSTVFASSGADDQVVQWDLAAEADNVKEEEARLAALPPQLLFIHQGQTDVKELHWHPQCPGTLITTAHSGFNVFRTISI